MIVARSRGTPPDATPRCCATVHDPFAREPAGCPTRWRAHARHPPMHPPTVPPSCHHTRSVRPRRPSPHCLPHGTPMPAPPCHHTRSARARETPPNVLPTLPALRTRARAPCRGARPVSLANVDARLRRAGFFIGCSEIKKKILKPPPHLYLGDVHPPPPFKKKK